MMKTAILKSLPLLLCLLRAARGEGDDEPIEYQNEIGCDLEVQCPKGYAMNAVYAKAGYLPQPGIYPPVPIPNTDDHQWFWNCEKIGYWKVEEERCYTYNVSNSVGGLVAFRCPKDSYIAGLFTTTTSPLDHIWSVRCCHQLGMCIDDCCLSDYLNEFGGDIEHSLSRGNFFVSIFSHTDTPEPPDNKRRWKVGACSFQKCDLKFYLKKFYYYKE